MNIIYGPMQAFLMKCFALLTLYTDPYKLRDPQSSRDSHITFRWHIELEYLDFRPFVIFTFTICMKVSICLIPSKIPNKNTHYVLVHSCQHQVKYECFVCCIIPLPSMELVYLPTWNETIKIYHLIHVGKYAERYIWSKRMLRVSNINFLCQTCNRF